MEQIHFLTRYANLTYADATRMTTQERLWYIKRTYKHYEDEKRRVEEAQRNAKSRKRR